jgi:hypothetical protein
MEMMCGEGLAAKAASQPGRLALRVIPRMEYLRRGAVMHGAGGMLKLLSLPLWGG